MTTRRIALVGGTFDPVHRAHIEIAEIARARLDIDHVWLVPSHIPPHRPTSPVASAFQRFAMVALAIAEHPGLRAGEIELEESGPSFTARTLARLAEEGYAPSQIFFVTGADAFAEIETWRDYPALLDRAHFFVVSRPGSPVAVLPTRLPTLAPRMMDTTVPLRVPAQPSILLVDAATSDVSSTEIRRRLAAGLPLDGMVPAAVENFARRHQLYRSAGSGSLPATHLHGQNHED
jgi:nicotinate-nucleotide adenylyltransferase